MLAKSETKSKNLILLLIAALILLSVAAGVSVSKFVFDDRKELVGVYTDFVLSHDGEGQTAVIRTAADGTSVGYIAVTVNNFTEDKISKRDVRFSLREPSEAELAAGKVTDAWGQSFSLRDKSGNYRITIVKESGEEYSEEELRAVAYLKSGDRSQSTVLLKITRKASAGEMPSEGSESFSVVLETSEPYRDLQVFTVNAAKTRISVGVNTDTYQGYEQKTVNLKTAIDFVKSENGTDGGVTNGIVSYTAKIRIEITGEALFDVYRFEEAFDISVDNNSGRVFEFYVEAGADLYLRFYLKGAASATIYAEIEDSEAGFAEEKVSGTGDGGLLFAKA